MRSESSSPEVESGKKISLVPPHYFRLCSRDRSVCPYQINIFSTCSRVNILQVLPNGQTQVSAFTRLGRGALEFNSLCKKEDQVLFISYKTPLAAGGEVP